MFLKVYDVTQYDPNPTIIIERITNFRRHEYDNKYFTLLFGNGIFHKNREEDATCLYYNKNQPIDCYDADTGAWFEAIIDNIIKIDNRTIYKVKWNANSWHTKRIISVSIKYIKHRAYKKLDYDDIEPGIVILVNYNTSQPEKKGFWYQFEVKKKKIL